MYGIEIVIKDNTYGNGATNIYIIVKGYLGNKERPNYLCRCYSSVVLGDTTESKFTYPEMDKPLEKIKPKGEVLNLQGCKHNVDLLITNI